MDSLEKLFLSCLVLFGMFILFLFGLYFDLGDMLASSFHHDERAATGVGITDRLIERMEEHARPHEIMPTELNMPTFVTMDDRLGNDETARQAMRALGRCVAPMTGKQVSQLKRQSLVAAGIQREEIIEMESLAADREEPSNVMRRATQLAGEKRFADAARELQTAIQATNPKNLLVLRDYLNLQVQVYLDGKQVDKAKESARKLYEMLDRIVAVRTLEGPKPEIEQEIVMLKTEKERLDSMYQDLQKRSEETGSPVGLTASEKAQMKDSLTRARSEGKMTEEEFQRAIKELES